MESKIKLYGKLQQIQESVKGLSKDKKSHNYDYVTGNKLLSFIKPLMDEHKLILKQEVTELTNERQDYKVWDKYLKEWKDKSEILSKVIMRFTWVDCETGETDVNMFAANGQNDWEKGLGSALTYGERYFLLKFFHIATDEDDIDNPNRKPEPKQVDSESLYPELKRLFQEKADKIPAEHFAAIEKTVNDKTVSKYSKVLNYLKGL